MNRALWVQKISDTNLKNMLWAVELMDRTDEIPNEQVKHIINGYYSGTTDVCIKNFRLDVLKEAAFRWLCNI